MSRPGGRSFCWTSTRSEIGDGFAGATGAGDLLPHDGDDERRQRQRGDATSRTIDVSRQCLRQRYVETHHPTFRAVPALRVLPRSTPQPWISGKFPDAGVHSARWQTRRVPRPAPASKGSSRTSPRATTLPELTVGVIILGCAAVGDPRRRERLPRHVRRHDGLGLGARRRDLDGHLPRCCARGNILQNNAVQTAAASGEGLAAGVIFTLPALDHPRRRGPSSRISRPR